ncbi:hypothetical protein R2R35_12410 [Anaerocolumna sp. AGMB13020]|uniref:hypothetical protein n=1 Tax=Anaerocolumna sp. AGMB13020 TaxID=3081750 RepID=UPI00295508B1|nr:hypothetical protein [Anaerocolumna sp. AGMB13020]WOO34605.1 hypothetical protein R2R35_12410 [Anaerocolumna sp. AGMB13020]
MSRMKIVRLAMLIISSFLLTACSFKDSADNNGEQMKAVREDAFSDKWYASTGRFEIAPGELTNIDLARPDNNNGWTKTLEIKYPQIYNMEDSEKETRINDTLYKEAVNYHDVLTNRSYHDYRVDYQLMEVNQDIVSILFLGEVSDLKTANSFAHAVTIDMNTELQLELKDFLDIEQSFVEDHLYTDFDVVENNFDEKSDNTPFIETFVNDYELQSHMNDFYINGDKIGIIIPTYNSMGYILLQGNFE